MLLKEVNRKGKNKQGQIAIYVLIAIVIIAAGIVVWNYTQSIKVPAEFKQSESTLQQCIAEITEEAISIAELQSGYVQLPNQEQANMYGFTNIANFNGMQVPFWFYLGHNGKIIKKIPSIQEIETQIAEYIEERFDECITKLAEQNISAEKLSEVKAKVKLTKQKALIELSCKVKYTNQNKQAIVTKHATEITTRLLKLYEDAKKILEAETIKFYIHNYTLDTLLLNLPTDGIQLDCAPLVFSVEQLKQNLKIALNNLQYINFGQKSKNDYFNVPIDVSENVNIIAEDFYFKAYPEENGIITFNPVGIQPGINLAGICYTPYHIVYDVAVPIIVQVFDAEKPELLQFAMLIIIDNNNIMNANITENQTIKPSELCNHKTKQLTLYSYDEYGNPIDADVYVKCLNVLCYIGKTQQGKLEASVPACINAAIIIKANGYEERKIITDTNQDLSMSVYLSKTYNVEVELKPKLNDANAIIQFIASDYSKTLYYPDQNVVQLKPGNYKIKVYVFSNVNVTFPSVLPVCTTMPFTNLKYCFNITIAEQQEQIKAIVGGGTAEIMLTQQDLEKGKIKIEIETSKPESYEDIQKIAENIEHAKINVIAG